jgi:hypothetical protein
MSEPIIVNPTPRQSFQSSPDFVKEHRELMQNQTLVRSVQFALAHFHRKLSDSRPPDGTSAAMTFFKLQGAHEFLDTLIKLGEPDSVQTQPVDKGQLNYKV